MGDWQSDVIAYTFDADNSIAAYLRRWNARYPETPLRWDSEPNTVDEDVPVDGESLWNNSDFVNNMLLKLVGDGFICDAVIEGLESGDADLFMTGLHLIGSCRDWVDRLGVPTLPMFVIQTVLDSDGFMDDESGGRVRDRQRLCASLATVVLACVSDKELASRLALLLLTCNIREYDRVLSEMGETRQIQ